MIRHDSRETSFDILYVLHTITALSGKHIMYSGPSLIQVQFCQTLFLSRGSTCIEILACVQRRRMVKCSPRQQ